MRAAALGFVAGAALLQTQAALPPVGVLAAMLALAALAGLLVRRLHDTARILLFACCGAAAGFAWAGLIAQHYLSQELPKEWEGRDVTVIGTVDSLPYRFEQGVRFHFAVERVAAADGEAPRLPDLPDRLALSWYSAFHADELQAVGDVQPGERWQLTVRLRRPHGNANPHGFDYEVWLLEQNLRATGYVRPDRRSALKNVRLDAFVPGLRHAVERARAGLRERIHDALPGKAYAGVIVALVIGDQRAIAQSDWKVFNRTGIGHLVSISGLHITMVAGLFAALVLALWRRSFFTRADLPLLLPAQKAAAAAGVGMALLYVMLAGGGIPAQRTLYMLMVVAAAIWFGRIAQVSQVLCAALCAVVLLDPWAVLWPGFWLSFGAVTVILFATAGRGHARIAPASRGAKWIAGLKSAARTQYVVTIGLVPLTMLLFGQISLVSPLANAIAIPLISFVVTPMSLVGSVLPAPPGDWTLVVAHQLVEWLALALQWLSESPAAVWSAPVPPWWMFAAALGGTLWLLAPAGWPVRWLGATGLLPLFLNAAAQPQEGEMWVTAFDVGQGTAVLVETPRRRLLYDTGPAYSPDSDGGNRVILPYLKARGITRLDALVVSHGDADHSGGALSILDEIGVDAVYSSLPQHHAIVGKAREHTRCEAGQSWDWDGMSFEMLHPSADSYDRLKLKPNARSCTLKISAGSRSILLPGDIEAPEEAALLDGKLSQLHASVLLAPHHGSGTSSTPAFLRAVQPEVAVFQVGYRNRYHHPKAEVFDRYGEFGIRRLRTDDSGAIRLHFGARLEVEEFRDAHARYWYGR
ncbi:MAG TPA: DNA internalization-related competence protein ComEC/Rec2 [Noviherbaspirillum sp.]|uniref:DNA internalization-related competence protein ComEC/Rec2 n=1 Tax=Noviherbaspirillum sp. TaxID=1926288 RepID=UPI002D53B1CD|nr:DNA internalization-related competence protein ComEC/Rec2 [Noviherbaspirillum sp.]HYD97076.1 DNA internalization-related competence protein ComEC/Rec2 [Noviherbaspirillum sp.]